METGGRQICKCNTDILILESDLKALNLRAFFFVCVCSPITAIQTHFTLLSAVFKACCTVLDFSMHFSLYNSSQGTLCLLLFCRSKLIYCFLVMQLEVQTDLKSLRCVTKEK